MSTSEKGITIGRIVHYRLTQQDIHQIQQMKAQFRKVDGLDYLTQGSSDIRQGEVFPAIVVNAFGRDQANLQVFVDGPVPLWVTSKNSGDSEGQWQWPQYSEAGMQGSSQKAGEKETSGQR